MGIVDFFITNTFIEGAYMEQKQKFIDYELANLSIQAALQRSYTYVEEIDDNDPRKADFRKELRRLLIDISEAYKNGCNEETHVNNIIMIADALTNKYGEILFNGRFRIGCAQKAFNLYLKYLWCQGRIAPPPHCPLDGTVIRELPGFKDVKWTQIDSIIEYTDIVFAAKEVSKVKYKNLSQWELELYNRELAASPSI